MTDSIRKRVVFDTNVFIAAYMARNAKSPTAFRLSIVDCRLMIENLYNQQSLIINQQSSVIPFDPDDDIIIACAVKGGATHIVTYDSVVYEVNY